MYPLHPEIMYDLSRHQSAERLLAAERERMVRRAGAMRPSGAIDAVPFRERLTRLFGALWPSTSTDGASPAAA